MRHSSIHWIVRILDQFFFLNQQIGQTVSKLQFSRPFGSLLQMHVAAEVLLNKPLKIVFDPSVVW